MRILYCQRRNKFPLAGAYFNMDGVPIAKILMPAALVTLGVLHEITGKFQPLTSMGVISQPQL
jgi:hypothetical protein